MQCADPFDDDHTRRDDAAAGSKLLVGPVPFIEVGDVAGEQHVDDIGSESIQLELRAVPEGVRCHDLGVGDLLGDATGERGLTRRTVPPDPDQHERRSVSGGHDAFDDVNHGRHGAQHAP